MLARSRFRFGDGHGDTLQFDTVYSVPMALQKICLVVSSLVQMANGRRSSLDGVMK